MATINRYERLHYLNVGGSNKPIWAPIGEGFTKFKEEKNATAFRRRFYHESDERTLNDGYSSGIVYEFDLHTGSPATELLRGICDGEVSVERGTVEVLCVDFFAMTDIPDTYRATVRRYSVIPEVCGDGADSLRYTGVLGANGEITSGIFVRSTGVFVADEEKE